MQPSGTALNAEHYQSFEMAKANDDVLGGENITAIRGYAARVRAEAQVIHKSLSMMSDYDDAVAAKSEIFESEQTLAKVGIYADQRIGEILRELPTGHGNRFSDTSETLKADALKDAGISKSQAYDLQAMAANPEVVEAVIAKATEEGRVVSRKQVLDAIDEKKRVERERRLAEQERDAAKRDLAEAYKDSENLVAENESLRRQVAEKPKPEVIEREVVPDDYETLKRKASDLSDDVRLYSKENKKLANKLESARKELEMARSMLGSDERASEIHRDVRYLINATDNYVKQYGGLTWTFEQLSIIDDKTIGELKLAVRNMAAFSSAMMTKLEELDGTE